MLSIRRVSGGPDEGGHVVPDGPVTSSIHRQDRMPSAPATGLEIHFQPTGNQNIYRRVLMSRSLFQEHLRSCFSACQFSWSESL